MDPGTGGADDAAAPHSPRAPFRLLDLPDELLNLVAAEAHAAFDASDGDMASTRFALAVGGSCRKLRPPFMRALWREMTLHNCEPQETLKRRAAAIEANSRWAGSTRKLAVGVLDHVPVVPSSTAARQLTSLLRHMSRLVDLSFFLTDNMRDIVRCAETRDALKRLPIRTLGLICPMILGQPSSAWSTSDARDLFASMTGVRHVNVTIVPRSRPCIDTHGLALHLPRLRSIYVDCMRRPGDEPSMGEAVAALVGCLAEAATEPLRELSVIDVVPWRIVGACPTRSLRGALVQLGLRDEGVGHEWVDAADADAFAPAQFGARAVCIDSALLDSIKDGCTFKALDIVVTSSAHVDAVDALIRRGAAVMFTLSLHRLPAMADIDAVVDRLVATATEARGTLFMCGCGRDGLRA